MFETAGATTPPSDMAARYATMSREERLTWHAAGEIRSALASISRLETEGPSVFSTGSAADQIAEYRARVGTLETLGREGRLAEDFQTRTLADARPAGEGRARETPEARVAAFIAADPELKALVADTEALALASGVDLPAFEASTEPSTLAEAIRAAAFCLTTDFVA